MDRLVYDIWLSLACTPDTATFSRLLESFDSAEEVYSAGEREIRSSVGASSSDCARLIDKDLTLAQKIYDFAKRCNVGLLPYYDPLYPEALRSIPTPPVMLYYRGKLPDFNKIFCCAVVGTRSLSDYGRNNAFHLGYDLGCAGATVVSGMAIGIDGVAMAGAIASGAPTIAVLGCGIDICYPAEHIKLARKIVENGCIITEYAPNTPPAKYNFPRRNRIISGLCAATVVVEGREKSGSVITAKHALKQGRVVYAFPGNVSNDGSQATNLLLKNGAKICTGADDIVHDFMDSTGTILNPHKLKIRCPVNMMSVLTELSVSATTPSDNVFRAPYAAPKTSVASPLKVASSVPTLKSDANDEISERSKVENTDTVPPYGNGAIDEPAVAFDPEAIRFYKRIPPDRECSIEELVDDETDYRKVMKLLLKLEMGRFVVMLPGDKVKRNIK